MSEWLQQTIGITRYEMVMQIRRRGVIALVGFLFVGIVGLSLISSSATPVPEIAGLPVERLEFVGDEMIATLIEADGGLVTMALPAEDTVSIPRWLTGLPVAQINGTFAVVFTAGISAILVMTGAAMMMADAIAMDHQVRVSEALDALPLHRSAYIVGKVLGAALPLGAGLTLLYAVYAAYARVRFGPYDLWVLTRFWFIVLTASGMTVAALAVVVGGLARRRRTALLLGIGLIPALIGLFALLMFSLFTVIDPSRQPMISQLSFTEVVSSMLTEMMLTQMQALLVVIACAAGLWLWLRLRETR